jgi:DUF1680 family protein
MAALEYGPIVYCVEGEDNNNKLDNLLLPDNASLKPEKRDDLLNGLNIITGNTGNEQKLIAIPYYAWANRIAGTMKVWLPRTKSQQPKK